MKEHLDLDLVLCLDREGGGGVSFSYTSYVTVKFKMTLGIIILPSINQERSNLLCESFPCQHGGTCRETSSSSYTCQCPGGYEGPTCASVVDNCRGDPCQNGGACISYNQGYKCSCPYGFREDQCQTQFDICNVANPCQNPGSTCTDTRGVVSCSCGAGEF